MVQCLRLHVPNEGCMELIHGQEIQVPHDASVQSLSRVRLFVTP